MNRLRLDGDSVVVLREKETEKGWQCQYEGNRGVETGLYRKYRVQVTGRKLLRLPFIRTGGVLIGRTFFIFLLLFFFILSR